MFKHSLKLIVLLCLSFLLVLMVAIGQVPTSRIVDLDIGEDNIRILGDDAEDWSGFSVSRGDINGDGFDDVIIGADDADPAGGSGAGETYVIFGSAAPPATVDLSSVSADMTIYGDDAEDYSGRSVSSGDINGDGYADVIIGAPDADPSTGRANAGETYVILGSAAPPATIDLNSAAADMTIYSDVYKSGGFGHSVSSGDINGDGYDDVIIGAYLASPDGHSYVEKIYVGETYVIFGSAVTSATVDLNSVSADMTIYADYAYDYSGQSVSCGDINGDGYADVIIGALGADPAGGFNAGETYVIFGSSKPPAAVGLNRFSAYITIYGDDDGDYSGYSVSSGDINGDGYDDVIIGAPAADLTSGDEAGETYVIFGSTAPPATIDLNSVSGDITIKGDDADDYSGCFVSCGDINGDGYDDVIIGAHNADPAGGSEAGETYVIFGSAAPPATIDLNSVSANMTIAKLRGIICWLHYLFHIIRKLEFY